MFIGIDFYECGKTAAGAALLKGASKSDWIVVCRTEYEELLKLTNRKKNVTDYREFVHGFWNVMSNGELYKR